MKRLIPAILLLFVASATDFGPSLAQAQQAEAQSYGAWAESLSILTSNQVILDKRFKPTW